MPKVNEKALFEDFPKEMLRLFKEVEKYVDVISKKWGDTLRETTNATNGMAKDRVGSGRLGLGSFSKAEKMGIGLGLAAFGAGTAMYRMAPDTMAAVTQRITADSYAGLSGMSSRQAIVGANKAVGGGATSAMGAVQAQQALFYSGYSANSLSSQTVMGQLSGMSAFSGMSNQQAAAGAGAMNGMMFLRMGINIRDSKGNLKPMDQIINQVYNFLSRGQKITQEQAATLRNPRSKGYASIQAIAGGDPNLTELITSGLIARANTDAKTFSSAMNSKDPNKMLDIMGVDKSSPVRANFRGSAAQAKVLQSTEQGLVGGYDAAVRTNAMLTSGFADLANALGPVTEALMTFKGALQTFPNTGNVGATISGVGRTATNLAGDMLAYKAISKFGPSIASRVGTSALGAGIAKKAAGGFFKKFLSKGLGKGLALGAGFLAGELVDPAGGGLIADAAIAGATSALGGPKDHGNVGHASKSSKHPVASATPSILPVPTSTPITQAYGHNGHPGIDYGAQLGTAVTSIKAGVVSILGNEPNGYGNWVEVKHEDGTATRYGHLKSIKVTRGQKVKAGEVLGYSGSTGKSTGPHLHFEVLVNGKKVDPTPYVSGAASPPPLPPQSGSVSSNTSRSGAVNHKNFIAADLYGGSSLSSSDLQTILNSSSASSSASGIVDPFGNGGAKNIGKDKSISWISGKVKPTRGIILGTGSKLTWAKTLLAKLGKPVTKENINALTTWAAWEGGQWKNSAHFNPLNTTQVYNGSTSMNDLGHGMGVQSYKSWADGYSATIQTLNNGRYKNILSALSKGTDSSSVLTAVDHSPWGTKIPGYGGPHQGMNVGSVSSGAAMSGVSAGTIYSRGGSGGSNVNLNMTVNIRNASLSETERLVSTVAARLKKELSSNPYSLDRLGHSL